jgi:hypothetical protein
MNTLNGAGVCNIRHARLYAGHPRLASYKKGVDGRDKPGHDEIGRYLRLRFLPAACFFGGIIGSSR